MVLYSNTRQFESSLPGGGDLMSILHSQQTQALINRLVGDEGNLHSLEAKQFTEFVRHYFHGAPYEDSE